MKKQAYFTCQHCGYRAPKWLGRCPECGSWESFVEEIVPPKTSGRIAAYALADAPAATPLSFDQIESQDNSRTATGIGEFDRVLGGGVVPGSLVLLGGEPGVGKSTLLLQVAASQAQGKQPVLYVSGEESEKQIKLRGERLGLRAPRLLVLPETRLEQVSAQAANLKPSLIVVDSIQTIFTTELESAPGSISQVRECAARFLFLAKSTGVPVFLIGHITKEGAIAGPKALEHIVDTVLYFEGERHHNHRIVRAVKNRFGASGEVAIFEMTGAGLMEVGNPSSLLLAERPADSPGAAVVCCIEGSRPLLVEVQALVSQSNFSTGRRMTQGFDRNRLSLIIAMLERVAGMDLLGADVYLNMAGGIEVSDPAADLGVVAAVVSSFRNRPVAADAVYFGEVGLAGEIRAVPQAAQRLKEASALGFRKCFLPAGNTLTAATPAKVETVPVRKVNQFLDLVF